MKDVEFRGSSLIDLRDFPQTAMREVGHQLDKVHCFKKKSQKTAQHDIELARKRFKELMKEISK